MCRRRRMLTRPMRVWIFAAIGSAAASGQPGASPEFEVASIRASNPDIGLIENRTSNPNTDPGRNLSFANISLRDLTMLAYGVGAPQISEPDWMRTTRFDIVAKVPAEAAMEQIPLMLRDLLAQRFKLALHRERKSIQIFALEVAKGG